MGRADDAAVVFDSVVPRLPIRSSLYVTTTDVREALGRAWQAAGRLDSAAVQYEYVSRTWRTADPQFQARRDSLRMRLTANGRVRRDETGTG